MKAHLHRHTMTIRSPALWAALHSLIVSPQPHDGWLGTIAPALRWLLAWVLAHRPTVPSRDMVTVRVTAPATARVSLQIDPPASTPPPAS